jgi:hypothetical protein
MKKILGAAIGSCVHVAGIINFLEMAKCSGFYTKFAGSALDVSLLKQHLVSFRPDIAGISYRLSPESSEELFESLEKMVLGNFKETSFILGTTKAVAAHLEKKGLLKIFDRVFTGGESCKEIEDFLAKKNHAGDSVKMPPQNLKDRIEYKKPYPLLRHHYGRPTVSETVSGIKKIAKSGLIDVVSIGPDQNAQEFLFKPSRMDPLQNGAGGVPVRSEEDFKKLFGATRTGNFPLMRCYSGTNDILKFADMLLRTISNAWCAVPLCWYNKIDNRSDRKIKAAIKENIEVMKWHAQRDIPVEVNESHHWSLRYAHDAVAVASAYLAAYVAKKAGVKTYVSQYMFNTPPETSFIMDLAKMLAKIELIESLHDDRFISVRETRTGLYSMPPDFNFAKGQLAASTMLQMQLEPSIVHVVAYCESSYAAKPDEIIESAAIVQRVIQDCIGGCPDMKSDTRVIKRKKKLLSDARLIIDKIKSLDADHAFGDPLCEPEIIAMAIKKGILDAPHLNGSPGACGMIRTSFFDGANYAISSSGEIISEEERLAGL